jgi:hypothetical protein
MTHQIHVVIEAMPLVSFVATCNRRLIQQPQPQALMIETARYFGIFTREMKGDMV